MLWRHARSRVVECLSPRRERQGKGQSLPLRLDLWLQPLMEKERHCQAPRRERQGKGQPLPLRLGLCLQPRRAQGRRCAQAEEEQGRGTLIIPLLITH